MYNAKVPVPAVVKTTLDNMNLTELKGFLSIRGARTQPDLAGSFLTLWITSTPQQMRLQRRRMERRSAGRKKRGYTKCDYQYDYKKYIGTGNLCYNRMYTGRCGRT